MRFRQHQKNARRISGHLLRLYAAAVVSVAGFTAGVTALLCSVYLSLENGAVFAVHKTVFAVVFVLVCALVAGAGQVRLRQLSAGGHVVAEALGGRRISRSNAGFDERRLLNVVEEMALASGVRMPKVYLLPDNSLNAFAAGMGQGDAVIGITQGALSAFNRGELQAVTAHEFSHILNGDMRLNMQLCGCLYGLQMISTLGHWFMGGETADTVRAGNFRLPTVVLGAVLLCIGFAGSLAAGWIQAAISRQREFLADASAVQFTRQSDGLACALYKVAVAPERRLKSPHAAEYAHFMFEGVHEAGIFDRLAATHPPILVRIERLSPAKARRWQHQIKQVQAVKQSFFYVPHTAGFSDGLQTQSAAGEAYRRRQYYEKLAAAIRKADPQSAQRREELLRYNPKHWLSAEGDDERLLVVLAALFDAAALEEAAAIWLARFPLRVAFYRRLQQHPLPPPLHTALLEFLLPSAAALPHDAQTALQAGLNRLLANRTLLPQGALLWLRAAAWLVWVPQAERPSENSEIAAKAVDAVTQWAARQGGFLDESARAALPQALSAAAALPARDRGQVMLHCKQIVVQSNMPQAEMAAEVLQLFERPVASG